MRLTLPAIVMTNIFSDMPLGLSILEVLDGILISQLGSKLADSDSMQRVISGVSRLAVVYRLFSRMRHLV